MIAYSTLTRNALVDAGGYIVRQHVQEQIRHARAKTSLAYTNAEQAAAIHSAELDLYCLEILESLVAHELADPRHRPGLPIEPTPESIGREVIYRARHPGAKEERGVITSYNASVVFVRYGARTTSAATSREELRWADVDHPHEGDPDHGRSYARQTKEATE